MPRVVGIDPGTLSVDVCGLEEGRLFLDRTYPTADVLADPAPLLEILETAGRLDLIAGPSGYGLPLTAARDLTDVDLRLAYLAAEGESGGIGGLRSLMRSFIKSGLPVVLTPGVIHMPSVPTHRKINRVDMGTADKVSSAVLAIDDEARHGGCAPHDVSLILIELGGAFTAALAIWEGRIVDGVGGTSGPIGARAAGGLDGEVAFLAGAFPKALLFGGGAAAIAGTSDLSPDTLEAPRSTREGLAWEAYLESAAKAVASMAVSVPGVSSVIVSGRYGLIPAVRAKLEDRLRGVLPQARLRALTGFATIAGQAAQGAALLADGLAGGRCHALVERMGIREAQGTVLDHLYLISPTAARRRLGLV